MATVTSRRPTRRRRLGLAVQMGRVLKALRLVDRSLDAEAVHHLRVALRRCRSLAVLMEEVDLHPKWTEMKRISRQLFRTLGTLRDTQVLENWVKKLAPAGDAVRAALITVLEEREVENRARARRALKQFDGQAWKHLAGNLERRARVVPPNGLAAQCLALERCAEISRLHVRAVRTERPIPWHELRIAVKQFRYAVESLLPARLAVWEEGLRQMQDLLGEIHDLNILDAFVAQETAGMAADSVTPLRHAIGSAREERTAQYRKRTTGPASPLQTWNAGLPQGAQVDAAATARLGATARALDPHPRRTARVSRLALRLFDTLVARGHLARFRGNKIRVILRAAAQLHGVRSPRHHASRQKAARAIVRALPVPPGWKSEDWEVLALVIRYHRGTEPTSTHGRIGRLRKARQELVRALAGILRVARALDHCGATTPSHLRAEETGVGVRLRVPGLIDTRAHAARLAAAKHLLETCLRRRLLIEST